MHDTLTAIVKSYFTATMTVYNRATRIMLRKGKRWAHRWHKLVCDSIFDRLVRHPFERIISFLFLPFLFSSSNRFLRWKSLASGERIVTESWGTEEKEDRFSIAFGCIECRYDVLSGKKKKIARERERGSTIYYIFPLNNFAHRSEGIWSMEMLAWSPAIMQSPLSL